VLPVSLGGSQQAVRAGRVDGPPHDVAASVEDDDGAQGIGLEAVLEGSTSIDRQRVVQAAKCLAELSRGPGG